jgi:DNA repair exonuclease SbcCD ATPase subunit
MKNRIIEGDELFRQGDIVTAEAKYREALDLIPEINKAHSYFLARGDDAEQVRRQTLRDFLGRAEAAYRRGEYSAALDNYTKALAYLPEDAATVEKMVSQVRRSGYELGIAQLRRQDTTNAAGPLASAEGLYNQEDYNGAILGYIDLIARYPSSSQVAAAVEGVNKSVEALEREAEARGSFVTEGTATEGAAADALRSDIAALEKTLEEKSSEIRDLRARLDAQSGDSSALEESIEEKNQEITTLKAEIEKARTDAGEIQNELEQRVSSLTEELEAKVALAETLQAEKQALEEEIASLNSQIEQMQTEQAAALADLGEELGKKISRLENVERRYNKLVDNYQEYARQEDTLLNARGEDALIQSKLYLNAFLTASEDSFPGLWERVKRYDEAFEKAGRASAAEDLSDILFEISVRNRPESRELYLESEKSRYRDVPEMVDLIDDLTDLVMQ